MNEATIGPAALVSNEIEEMCTCTACRQEREAKMQVEDAPSIEDLFSVTEDPFCCGMKRITSDEFYDEGGAMYTSLSDKEYADHLKENVCSPGLLYTIVVILEGRNGAPTSSKEDRLKNIVELAGFTELTTWTNMNSDNLVALYGRYQPVNED
jgi:hypothetical protein